MAMIGSRGGLPCAQHAHCRAGERSLAERCFDVDTSFFEASCSELLEAIFDSGATRSKAMK